ncbi:uncharacterized protein LOC142225323 [Haematobia irritans]|uniref:uncharacterized protein LOC142225323 n=1 Tax=Haematobia irritans TaxID=7368 RepID=UPI003F506C2A
MFLQIIITICFIVCLGPTKSSSEHCDIYSTSATCQKLNQIIMSMDEKLDPCDDFYSYACKNWGSRQDSIVDVVDYRTNLKLISIIEAMANDPPPRSMRFFNLSYVYYKACVSGQGRRVDMHKYLDLIKPGPGLEWPLLEELRANELTTDESNMRKWNADSFDIFPLLAKLRSYGLNHVLIDSNAEHTDGENKTFYLGLPTHTDSLAYSTELLTDLGFSKEMALTYTEKLQKIHFKYKPRYPRSRMLMYGTYQLFSQQYPQLTNFIDKIETYKHKRNNIQIIVDGELLFPSNLYSEANAEEKRTLCNYIMIRMLSYLVGDSPKYFSKLVCINDLRNKMDLPVNLLYYENVYKPHQFHYNADIPIFFNKTRDYISESIFVKETLIDKFKKELQNLTLNMGNIPRKMHLSSINDLFRDIPELDVHNYYSNQLHLLQYRNSIEFHSIWKCRTHKLFVRNNEGQNTARPTYDKNLKMIILPLDILQMPIYHYTYDPLFKWSMLGFLISEIIYRDVLKAYTWSLATDAMAVDAAYLSYLHEIKTELNFTSISRHRLFFLNIAQLFCTHYGNETKSRLNALVRNSSYFGMHFHCFNTLKKQ